MSIYGGRAGNQGSGHMQRNIDDMDRITIRCLACGKEQEPSPRLMVCSYCGGPLEIGLDLSRTSRTDFLNIRSMWRYRSALPMGRHIEPVTLGEGATPLIRLKNIERIIGVRELYAKIEGANPTGSFKDRGMSLAVSIANSHGYSEFIVASTGNTAASASAYGARAGKRVTVVLPRGYVANGKLFQSMLHGARILYVDGSFDDALSRVIEDLSRNSSLYPLNSVNPWRLEGQKTAAYEISEDLGELDAVFIPVGNGGNIYAVYKGFAESIEMGVINEMPRIFGVQAKGASPIYMGWNLGGKSLESVDKPETIATAIRIGRPANWLKAFKAARESRGFFISVDDQNILASQRMLAKLEGVGCEPASAASLAGLVKLIDEGVIEKDLRIAIILTGHSLKDPMAR